ncbi:MAG TPA: hypothetical protein VFV67_17745 [Actinophytocola sp.]|uniref:hypothetical protein n=1 Tax=Actinophytocola sp. TaxID=1872138 RepID=UPI002DB5A5B8|nr:hypothetical protein [Actinophytocola sp.]HEU5472497.1 hypothetical protein [Actinophytocola sp.]
MDSHRDAALVAAMDGLHADTTRLLTTLAEYRAKSNALVEACMACLEAAQCIAGLWLTARRLRTPLPTERPGSGLRHAGSNAGGGGRRALEEAGGLTPERGSSGSQRPAR